MSRAWMIVLVALAVGCGREAPPAVTVAPPDKPATNLPPEKPDTPAPKPTVWPARELAKVLDLASLPVIENTKFGVKMASRLDGTVPATVPEAVGFYQAKMVERGWKAVATADKLTDDLGALNFLKDGHFVNLTTLRTSPDKDGTPRTIMTFVFHGNFDAATLPRREGVPWLFGSPTLAIYTSEAKLPDESAWIAEQLKAAGWEEFGPVSKSTKVKSDDLAHLTFRKQGYALKAFLVSAPAQGNKTSVQLSITALSHELPAPPGAAELQFDDARWEMNCKAPGTVEAVGAWYQKAMPAAGYVVLPIEDAKPKSWTLRFGTDGGDIVMVSLTSDPDATTRVNVYGVPKAVLDKLKVKG